MATTGFDLLAQEGAANAGAQAAARRAAEVEQRQQKLATYQNALDHAQTPEDRQQIFNQIQTLYPTPAHAHHLLADLTHLRSKKTAPTAPSAATGTPPPSFQGVPVAQNPSEVLQGAPAAVPAPVKAVAQAKNPDDALKLIMGNYSSVAQDATKTEKEKEDAAYRLRQLVNQGAIDAAKAKGPTQIRQVIRSTGNMLPDGAIDESGDVIERDPRALYQRDPMDPNKWQQIPGSWQTKTLGNREYFFNPQTQEQVLASNDQGQPMGPVKLPTTAVSTQTSPGGQQVETGSRTTALGTAPVSSSTPQPPGSPAPSVSPGPTLHNRSAQPISTKTPQPPSNQSILPNIQGMTPHNAAMAQKAQPAVTALLGLYGDPGTPSVKSMADFADLAADPHAQKVIGTAFKLLDQQMGEISDPGMIQTLATVGGWANFRAKAEADAQRQSGEEMTPTEKEYFDTAIASMADIIGARSATGQSPARFSVRAIQNELPLIGTGSTTDPASYLTKMMTIARQIRVGLNAMPDNSRALAYLQKRENDLIQQSNALSKKLNKGKPVSSKTPSAPSNVRTQTNKKTGAKRYSMDGGKTWQPGTPPQPQ